MATVVTTMMATMMARQILNMMVPRGGPVRRERPRGSEFAGSLKRERPRDSEFAGSRRRKLPRGSEFAGSLRWERPRGCEFAESLRRECPRGGEFTGRPKPLSSPSVALPSLLTLPLLFLIAFDCFRLSAVALVAPGLSAAPRSLSPYLLARHLLFLIV